MDTEHSQGLRRIVEVMNTRADEIADAVIKRLASEGYDAFRSGSYHDISDRVRQVIVEEIQRAVDGLAK